MADCYQQNVITLKKFGHRPRYTIYLSIPTPANLHNPGNVEGINTGWRAKISTPRKDQLSFQERSENA